MSGFKCVSRYNLFVRLQADGEATGFVPQENRKDGVRMKLRSFLHQSVTLERSTGGNEWGDASYSAPETLPARKELKQGRVVSAGGGEVISSTTRLLMVDQVALGDKVDGLPVVAVESIVDLGGKTLGFTAYL